MRKPSPLALGKLNDTPDAMAVARMRIFDSLQPDVRRLANEYGLNRALRMARQSRGTRD
jgi:hypothetical protein